MAIIQRSGKVKTQASSPIALSLPAAASTSNSLVVVVSSYSGGTAQTFSGSCGGTALAVAVSRNHSNNVAAVGVLYLVDPPSGQTTVTVQSAGNSGYYTAELIEVPKIDGAMPVEAVSLAAEVSIPTAGGSVTLTPNAGTTTGASTLVVTGWATSGATATTVGSAAAPAGYELGFTESDDVNSQCGASAYAFNASAGATAAPAWTITASADGAQSTYLVGVTVILRLVTAGDPARVGILALLEDSDVFSASATVGAAPVRDTAWRADTSTVTLDNAQLYTVDYVGASTTRTAAAALLERADAFSAAASLISSTPSPLVLSVDHAYLYWSATAWVPAALNITVGDGESLLVLCAGWNTQGADKVPTMTAPGLTPILDQGANYALYQSQSIPVYCQAYAAWGLSAGTYTITPPGYSTSADDGDMWVIRLKPGCALRSGSSADMHDADYSNPPNYTSATCALGAGALVGDAGFGICVTDNWTVTPTLAITEQTGWSNLGRQTNGQGSAVNSADWTRVTALGQSANWTWPGGYDCRVRSAVVFAVSAPSDGGASSADAALLEARDAFAASAVASVAVVRTALERRDAAAGQGLALLGGARTSAETRDAAAGQVAALLRADRNTTERRDTLNAALSAVQSSVLDAVLIERKDTASGTATLASAALAALGEARNALSSAGSAHGSAQGEITNRRDAPALQSAAQTAALANLSSARDALTAQFTPQIAGAMDVLLSERRDSVSAAATARSLASSVLENRRDALTESGALSAFASAALENRRDSLAALATAQAQVTRIAVDIIEARNVLQASASGGLLAGALLIERDLWRVALSADSRITNSALYEKVDRAIAAARVLIWLADPQQDVFYRIPQVRVFFRCQQQRILTRGATERFFVRAFVQRTFQC